MIKSIVSMLIKNTAFKKLYLKISNKLSLNGNVFSADSINFRKNALSVSGKANSMVFGQDSFMRYCKVRISGEENTIEIKNNTEIYSENSNVFNIDGNGNEVIIGNNSNIRNTSFFIRGNNNKIILGNDISCYGAEFHIEQDNNDILIGNGTSFHGRNGYPIHIAADEGTKVTIEDDCMLSNGIQIRSTDSHSIVNENGDRINQAEDILINNHCWICFGSIILK